MCTLNVVCSLSEAEIRQKHCCPVLIGICMFTFHLWFQALQVHLVRQVPMVHHRLEVHPHPTNSPP